MTNLQALKNQLDQKTVSLQATLEQPNANGFYETRKSIDTKQVRDKCCEVIAACQRIIIACDEVKK